MTFPLTDVANTEWLQHEFSVQLLVLGNNGGIALGWSKGMGSLVQCNVVTVGIENASEVEQRACDVSFFRFSSRTVLVLVMS